MIVINASAQIITPIIESEADLMGAREDVYNEIERAARTCYKSITSGEPQRQDKFIRNLVNAKHFAMIEQGSATVRFIVDRGVSHEIVRHRLASYAQESTRYCRYDLDKFGEQITVVKPFFFDGEQYSLWHEACVAAEQKYMELLAAGATAEQARSVLPMSVKTEVVMKADMTEWRHFFRLRAIGTTGSPHPQMAEVAVPLLQDFCKVWPAIFYDLEVEAFEKGVFKQYGKQE